MIKSSTHLGKKTFLGDVQLSRKLENLKFKKLNNTFCELRTLLLLFIATANLSFTSLKNCKYFI